MKKLNQPKLLLAVLCSAIAFNAHALFWDSLWGNNTGDDGNPNTVGNVAAAAAKSSKMATSKNQSINSKQQLDNLLIVGVVNSTNTILASAVLKDNKTGRVPYTSTKGKTCAIGDVCRLRVNRKVLTKDTTFFFYDTNNKLTSAYLVKETPATGAFGYDISVSMNSLGMYVLNRIQVLNPKISYGRIDQDIVTTTLQATPYEELADYYLDLLGSSKDDSKTIAGLATQFAKNKSIPANPNSVRLARLKAQKVAVRSSGTPVKSTRVKSGKPSLQSSSAQETLCSTEVQTGFQVASKLPIPYASNVADITTYILGKTCGQDDSGMADKFSGLSSQMQILQTGMDTVAGQLTSVEQKQTKLAAIGNNITNQTDVLDIKQWTTNYSTVLAKYQNTEGKKFNSLNEFIDSCGGISQAIKKHPGLDIDLSLVYSGSGKMREALNHIGSTDTISAFVDNMKDMCQNPNKIFDGVFLARSWCDLAITNIYARNAILGVQMKYAYNDVNKVFEQDTRTEVKRLANWQPITNEEFNKFDTTVSLVSPQKIFFNMIEPTDSIVATADNLKNAGFTINEWYPDKNKRYLDVQGIVAGTTIKSKYAYQEPTRSGTGLTYDDGAKIDSRVLWIMGVPVPERFFTGVGSDGKRVDNNNYGADNAFPWADKSILADIGTSNAGFANASVVADFKFPASGNVAVYADGFQPDNTINSRTYIGSGNNGSVTQQTYDGKKFTRDMFSAQNGMYRVSTMAYRDYKLVGGGEYFTYIRYTSADGYSSIWAMRTWLDAYGALSSNSTPGYRMYGAPQCMTNDCVAVNTGGKLEKLYFWKGPNIEWAYETSQDHFIFNLKETK